MIRGICMRVPQRSGVPKLASRVSVVCRCLKVVVGTPRETGLQKSNTFFQRIDISISLLKVRIFEGAILDGKDQQ